MTGPQFQPERITLDCHHTTRFSAAYPMVGDEIYCVRCLRMQVVVEAPPEFRIRCMACPFSRRTGSARLSAETKAAKHHQSTGHKVGIYNGRKRIYVMGQNDSNQRALPLAYEAPLPPPF